MAKSTLREATGFEEQLPGTVRPPDAVIYDFTIDAERFMHVVVMGKEAELVENGVGYRKARDHWFFRSDAGAANRIAKLLDANAACTIVMTVAEVAPPGNIRNAIRARQDDSHFEFRSLSAVGAADWVAGQPGQAPAQWVLLDGPDPINDRRFTFRLNIDQSQGRLMRAVWHSPDNEPPPFFDGKPEKDTAVVLTRIASNPWSNGQDYYYDETLSPH
jgi:hypothetical protein